jgi:hypothetical protein
VLNCLASVHKLKKAFSKQISGSLTVNHERNPYGKNANFKHTFSWYCLQAVVFSGSPRNTTFYLRKLAMQMRDLCIDWVLLSFTKTPVLPIVSYAVKQLTFYDKLLPVYLWFPRRVNIEILFLHEAKWKLHNSIWQLSQFYVIQKQIHTLTTNHSRDSLFGKNQLNTHAKVNKQ